MVLAFSDGLSLPSRDALFGDALCVLGAVLWGSTTVLIKGSVLREVSAEKTLLYQLAVSAVFGLAVSIAIGESVGPAILPPWSSWRFSTRRSGSRRSPMWRGSR